MRYDFICQNCNETNEFDLPMDFEMDSSLVCPKCKQKKMKRVISVPNISTSGSNSTTSSTPACSTGGCCLSGSCGV